MRADSSEAPFKIYNIGSNKTVRLMDIIKFYEKNFQLKAKKILGSCNKVMSKELKLI